MCNSSVTVANYSLSNVTEFILVTKKVSTYITEERSKYKFAQPPLGKIRLKITVIYWHEKTGLRRLSADIPGGFLAPMLAYTVLRVIRM
jgi:hypothetical protein